MSPVETISLVGGIIGIVGGLYVICEKIWGGGNKLAKEFQSVKDENKKDNEAQAIKHAAEMAAMRAEFITRVDTNSNNTRIGIDAIGANIHEMQIGFEKFRAFMAENYMRRDSYKETMGEWKTDFKETMGEFKTEIRNAIGEVKDDVDALAKSVEAARRERG